jgi:hypothetical protein
MRFTSLTQVSESSSANLGAEIGACEHRRTDANGTNLWATKHW